LSVWRRIAASTRDVVASLDWASITTTWLPHTTNPEFDSTAKPGGSLRTIAKTLSSRRATENSSPALAALTSPGSKQAANAASFAM
jgi:hypothetical protein